MGPASISDRIGPFYAAAGLEATLGRTGQGRHPPKARAVRLVTATRRTAAASGSPGADSAAVHYYIKFIINERAIISYMTNGTAPDLEPYRLALETWLPKAAIRTEVPARKGHPAPVDGVLTWKANGQTIRYL